MNCSAGRSRGHTGEQVAARVDHDTASGFACACGEGGRSPNSLGQQLVASVCAPRDRRSCVVTISSSACVALISGSRCATHLVLAADDEPGAVLADQRAVGRRYRRAPRPPPGSGSVRIWPCRRRAKFRSIEVASRSASASLSAQTTCTARIASGLSRASPMA